MQLPFGLNEYRQLATAFMNAKLKHKITLSVDKITQDYDALFEAKKPGTAPGYLKTVRQNLSTGSCYKISRTFFFVTKPPTL